MNEKSHGAAPSTVFIERDELEVVRQTTRSFPARSEWSHAD